MYWPVIGVVTLIVLLGYPVVVFTRWVLTGSTRRNWCHRENRPCYPDKCTCWDLEQEKRRADLDRQWRKQ